MISASNVAATVPGVEAVVPGDQLVLLAEGASEPALLGLV